MTFISLGSGSCGNCYYLGTESDAILIDCGIGIRRLKKSFHEYGIKISRVRAILVTHDHSDHIKTVGLLSREHSIPVYTTEAIHHGMKRNYAISMKVDDAHQCIIEKDTPFCIGEFEITAFQLPHDATDNMGYFIKVEGFTFTLMTDVGSVTDNVRNYIGLSNYLVIEANYDEDMLRVGRYPEILKDRICSGTGHLSNAQSAKALIDNLSPDLRHVWLCHLSEENNHPELARKTFDAALRQFGIIPDVDFTIDVLRRKMPTGPFTLS